MFIFIVKARLSMLIFASSSGSLRWTISSVVKQEDPVQPLESDVQCQQSTDFQDAADL